jgi:DNA-binding MarR family transcriptional regulator
MSQSSPSSQSPTAPAAPTVPFQVPPYPPGCSISLAQARVDLPPEEYRHHLRKYMLDHPGLTLAQIGRQLNISRQRVSMLVGRLNRPNCAHAPRPAPRKAEAQKWLPELTARVAGGESAEKVAASLGISLSQSMRLGLRVRQVRPPHGTRLRAMGDDGRPPCFCWRCKRAAGISLPRGPRTGPARRAQVLDWLAYNDPDTGEKLSQSQIARLAGVHQPLVSRLARQMGGTNGD